MGGRSSSSHYAAAAAAATTDSLTVTAGDAASCVGRKSVLSRDLNAAACCDSSSAQGRVVLGPETPLALVLEKAGESLIGGAQDR